MESGNRARVPASIKANVARVLLQTLSTQCKSYCIVSGYDRLPDNFETDIDFMVDQEDFDRMPRIIEEVGRKTGTHLFQAIDHELTGRAYFLGSIDGPSLTIVQPDCAADYWHFGRRWLPAKEVLARAPLSSQRFLYPSIAHEFAYSLIKRLNKRSFNREARLQTPSLLRGGQHRVRPHDRALLPRARGLCDRAHGLGQRLDGYVQLASSRFAPPCCAAGKSQSPRH